MSFAEAVSCSVGRAALVATGGVVLASSIPITRGRWSGVCWWVLALSPMVMPGLLVGYAYADLGLSLARHEWASEAVYVGVLLARFAGVAAVAAAMSPPPALTPAASYAARLAGHRVGLAAWAVHGSGRVLGLAWVATFVLAFGEFELASLMVRPAWTVWLFDAQVVGLGLGESLRYAMWPAGVSLVGVALAVMLGWRREGRVGGGAGGGVGGRVGGELALNRKRGRVWERVMSFVRWGGAVGAFAVGVGVPVGLLISASVGGWRGTAWGEALWGEEVRASLGVAWVSGVLVGACVLGALNRKRWRSDGWGLGWWTAGWGAMVAGAICVAGLVGPLVLGLSIVWLFQRPGLRVMYGTPVVWVGGLVVWLLPVGVVLGLWAARGRAAGSHAATLLGRGDAGQRRRGGGIAWRLRGRPAFWGTSLLVMLAFWDVTLAKLLAPVWATPVSVMLYNLMHYGRDATLTVRAMLAAGALVTSVLLVRGAVELVRWVRWRMGGGAGGRVAGGGKG